MVISHGVFENFRSRDLMISTANKHIDHNTLLKYLLTVSSECWNLSWTFLYEAPNANV